MHIQRLVLMVVLSAAAVGSAAVLSLGGPPNATQDEQARDLVRRLADGDPDVRRDVEARLRAMDKVARPALREATAAEDAELARRARRLLDEMERRVVEAAPEPRPEPPAPGAPEPARPAVEIVLQVPHTQLRCGESLRFYVHLRNNGPQPLLVARHRMHVLPLYREFARLEIDGPDGQTLSLPPELWPRVGADEEPQLEVVSVPPGGALDLYCGSGELSTALHTRLLRTGQYGVRFVYDATGVYRDVVAKEHGAPLPAERIASNPVTIVIQ